MKRIAAIDCGTNSLRLLISQVEPDGRLRQIERIMEIVRLGQGVDDTGKLSNDALARTEKVLRGYVRRMEAENVDRVRMVATSATRDASNRDDFFSMTENLLGKPAEVISGEEEASLSFRGAVQDLSGDRGPFCVIDLGGGSTEFIVGDARGQVAGAHSTNMGCVRFTERIMRQDPPSETEIEIARDAARKNLAEVLDRVPLGQVPTLVGCAGTFTTLSALSQGLERYDAAAIHHSELNFDALRVMTRTLIRESTAERAMNPVIHEGRADVIAAGSVIVEEIMTMAEQHTLARTFIISEKDILDGIVGDLAG